MAENTDKSCGWYKSQHFSDYIVRIVGEINFNFKFISILIIFKFICILIIFKFISILINFNFISILIIFTNTLTGDYGQELEQRKFDNKVETDFYGPLESCADLVWNGEFFLKIVKFFILTLSPAYQQVKQEEGQARTWMLTSVTMPPLKSLRFTFGSTLGEKSTG